MAGSVRKWCMWAALELWQRPSVIPGRSSVMDFSLAVTAGLVFLQTMYGVDEQTWSYVVLIFGLMAFVLYAMTAGFILISFIGARFYLHKRCDSGVLGDDLPGVSVVKPLMGVDSLLEENLESHFKLNYPKIEFLLCFPDDQDPALNLVHRLQEKYPKVDIRIFTGGKDGIINPMVQNMTPGYENAKYEYVWISTSRIRATDDILMDMVCRLQKPNVALVHQMPFYCDVPGFGATVEKVYFGCVLARYYLAFNFMGLCCVTGMSYIFKKPLLDQLSGLGWYGRYLAEDFFLTKALHEKGYKLVVSAYPALQNVANVTLSGFVDRMIRWLRLRLNMLTIVSVLEPMTDCFPLGLYTAWSLNHFFGINFWIFFPSHIFAWMVIDYLQLRKVQNGPLAFSKLRFVMAWLTREFLATGVFFMAVISPHRVKWGRHTYSVKYGGHTSIVESKNLVPV